MQPEKVKSLQLTTKFKETEVEGERRILFVASSNNTDRHQEQVDVASLRLPLRTGGHKIVSEIPAEGAGDIDIPLMLNHSGDIRDVIGSVRKAYYAGGELLFEAGISNRGIAQEILKLMEEDHLGNAFSITMTDYDYNYDSGTISNAEVIEVSVVYRGSNKEARLLAVKSLDGETEMEEPKVETPQVEEPKAIEPVEESPEEETPAEAPATDEPEQKEDIEKDAEPEAEESTEEPTEEKEQETEMNEIAQDGVVAKAAPVQSIKGAENYLASKKSLQDFKNIVLANHRGSNEQIMKSWMENLKTKAVAGDAILPSAIESIFFKAWTDNTEIVSTFRQLGVRAGAVYAMVATENGAAKGHTKGAQKVNQTVEAIRRDLKALCLYKKLPIDLQDLFDDETGELLRFRVEELASRIAHAIAVGAILGDSTNVYLSSGRGLNPMATDINAVSGFGAQVATKIANVPADTEIQKAIKTTGAVEGSAILVVPKGWKTDARLALIALNYPVADIAEFVGAKAIFELEEMANSGFDMIAYADQSYVLAGESSATVRTDFDLNNNQDIMLVERFVAGSATGHKTVAGYASAE